MKDLNEFLDRVKEVTGSDYKTAKELNIANQLVGNWRGGRSIPTNRHVLTMCDIAKIDLREAILAIEVTREKKAMKREVYKYAGAATAMAGFATAGMMGFIATIMLCVTLIVTLPPSSTRASVESYTHKLCILCKIYNLQESSPQAANDDSYGLYYITPLLRN